MRLFHFLLLALLGVILFGDPGMTLAIPDDDSVKARDDQVYPPGTTSLPIHKMSNENRMEEQKKSTTSISVPFVVSVLGLPETFTLEGGTFSMPAETVGSATLAAETITRPAQTTTVLPGTYIVWTRDVKPTENRPGADHTSHQAHHKDHVVPSIPMAARRATFLPPIDVPPGPPNSAFLQTSGKVSGWVENAGQSKPTTHEKLSNGPVTAVSSITDVHVARTASNKSFQTLRPSYDWAMECGERGMSNYCSEAPYLYRCDAAGHLSNSQHNITCDTCACKNLKPCPSPPVFTGLEFLCLSLETGWKTCDRTGNGVVNRVSPGFHLPVFGGLPKTSIEAQPPQNSLSLVKRHDYAVFCQDAAETKVCMDYPFLFCCTEWGQVFKLGTGDSTMCRRDCICVDLNPKIPAICYWRDNYGYCLRRGDFIVDAQSGDRIGPGSEFFTVNGTMIQTGTQTPSEPTTFKTMSLPASHTDSESVTSPRETATALDSSVHTILPRSLPKRKYSIVCAAGDILKECTTDLFLFFCPDPGTLSADGKHPTISYCNTYCKCLPIQAAYQNIANLHCLHAWYGSQFSSCVPGPLPNMPYAWDVDDQVVNHIFNVTLANTTTHLAPTFTKTNSTMNTLVILSNSTAPTSSTNNLVTRKVKYALVCPDKNLAELCGLDPFWYICYDDGDMKPLNSSHTFGECVKDCQCLDINQAQNSYSDLHCFHERFGPGYMTCYPGSQLANINIGYVSNGKDIVTTSSVNHNTQPDDGRIPTALSRSLSTDYDSEEAKIPALGPRHNYALICNNIDLTRLCQLPPFQYFCTAAGRLFRQGLAHHECNDRCACRLLAAGNPYQNVIPNYCGVFNWKNIECGLWTNSMDFEKQAHQDDMIDGPAAATSSTWKRTEPYSSLDIPDIPRGRPHPTSQAATLTTVTKSPASSMSHATCASADQRTCPTSITVSGISMPLPDGIGPFCTVLRAEGGAGAGAGLPYGADVQAFLKEYC